MSTTAATAVVETEHPRLVFFYDHTAQVLGNEYLGRALFHAPPSHIVSPAPLIGEII